MKEIKAFVHRNRIGDVVHALKAAGFEAISIVDVKGMLRALDAQEQEYSIEIGEKIITEVKLEMVCETAQVAEAIEIIRLNAQTGQANGGAMYVSDIEAVYPIHTTEETA